MTQEITPSARRTPLYWLALGTFATGTESFMIAPLLPDLAVDLSVSVVATGQLVTVFALTYAFSSPIMTTLTGRLDRRLLLIFSMLSFAAANFIACSATSYSALMGARILLAIAAGLYVPNAGALAGALVEPARRGRALAIVTGGTTVAVALGVPLGAFIGSGLGWRTAFAGVGFLGVIATAGLVGGMARNVARGLTAPNLRERLAVTRQRPILVPLLGTVTWAMGSYVVYTYLALFLVSATEITGPYIGLLLFIWGVAAAIGIFGGGLLNDSFGSRSVIVFALVFQALALASLSVSAGFLSRANALMPILIALAVWGVSAWSFFPPQQARLIGIAGLKLAPVVLSLNASFMYIGFSFGAFLGSIVLAYASPGALGWVGAACTLTSLLLTKGGKTQLIEIFG